MEKDEKTKDVASKDDKKDKKPAKAASSGGKEKAAEDPQTKELLKCTKQAEAVEATRLKHETAYEECSRKLQKTELDIEKEKKKAMDESALRAQAVVQMNESLQEEKKAVKLAKKEKKTRE